MKKNLKIIQFTTKIKENIHSLNKTVRAKSSGNPEKKTETHL